MSDFLTGYLVGVAVTTIGHIALSEYRYARRSKRPSDTWGRE
jgi:hypothetical protein